MQARPASRALPKAVIQARRISRGAIAAMQPNTASDGASSKRWPQSCWQGASPPAPAVPKRPRAAGLPEQIKAVADTLAASPVALTLADIEARFTARGRWRERLPTILDTLEALGRARRPQAGVSSWQGA